MFCEKRDSVNRRSRGREFGEAPLRDGYAPLSRSSESRSIRRTFAGVRALTEPHASSASTPLPNLHERDGLPSVDNAANGCTTHGNAPTAPSTHASIGAKHPQNTSFLCRDTLTGRASRRLGRRFTATHAQATECDATLAAAAARSRRPATYRYCTLRHEVLANGTTTSERRVHVASAGTARSQH